MALAGSDYFLINRAGAHYKLLASDVLAYVEGQIGTTQFEVANITARNALANVSIGDRVFVVDATGDATVASGWAIYVNRGASTWTKMAEQEGLDVVVGGANLGYTASATQGVVTSSSGSSATLPAGTGTNAGLLVPAQFNKLGFLTVTGATDLDAIRTASHAAVTLSGSATTNPLTLSGQILGFNIANLTTAP
jgi:energy-converting hydrogenase Eha subunit G